MRTGVRGGTLLASRPVPALYSDQLERFTLDSLRATEARRFDALRMLSLIRSSGDKRVLAIDIGGDKLVWSLLGTQNGFLERLDEGTETRSEAGRGYLSLLERIGALARRDSIPVGISFAGPIQETKPVAGPNLGAFIADLYSGYDGDFGNIFHKVRLSNDAEAGILAGAVEAASRFADIANVIYVINGSGIGGAVLKDKRIYAAEPGHVEVESELNLFNQRKACGLLGASHVCIEVVAASKAGIEDIWFRETGQRCDGQQIAAKYLAADPVALDLYDNSAIFLPMRSSGWHARLISPISQAPSWLVTEEFSKFPATATAWFRFWKTAFRSAHASHKRFQY